MLKHQLVGRLGLILGICVFGTACIGGEIGDDAGGPRFGPETSDPGTANNGSPEANNPAIGNNSSPEANSPAIGNNSSPEANSPAIGDGGSPVVCPGASADVSASSGWQSSEASLPADGTLRFEFKARPTAADLNGLVAVGSQDIDAFTKAAIAVRFAKDGFVDARDGGIYDSDVPYPYDPGVWYSVSVSADIQSETYDVEIGPCGEPQQKLIEDAAFRDDASVSDQLNAWAVWSSQSAALEVATPAWIASSAGCMPSTCETLGHVCGQPSDGCGGTLSCGGCSNGQMCSSGSCIDESVPPPPCEPATCQTLNAECGLQSNGCGGTLSCGGCSNGQMCSGGVCIAEPAPPPPCEPATCQSLSAECGQPSDGCNNTLSCGACGSGETCESGVCVDAPATEPPPAIEPPAPSAGAGDPSDRPWAHNTGPTDLGALRPSGSMTITTDGAVLENLNISGGITIAANDVTLRNFIITGGTYGIRVNSGTTGFYVEDGDIKGTSSAGIYATGQIEAHRLHIYEHGADAMKIEGNNSLIEACFIEKVGTNASAHADGNQSYAGNNITFRGNNFWMPHPGTPNFPGGDYKSNSAHIIKGDSRNFYIDGNWLNAGAYTIYCTSPNTHVTNNFFGRDFHYGVRSGTCATWTNNRFEDNDQLIP